MKMRHIAIVGCLLLPLVATTATAGEGRSDALAGAVIGAALGGIIGSQVNGGGGNNVAIGVGMGAAAGALIGASSRSSDHRYAPPSRHYRASPPPRGHHVRSRAGHPRAQHVHYRDRGHRRW